MKIRIEDGHGRLIKDTWEFRVKLAEPVIQVELALYARSTRPSTRHRNWNVVQVWASVPSTLRVGAYRDDQILTDRPVPPAYVRAWLQHRVLEAMRWPE